MKSSGEVTIYDIAKVLNISPSTVSRGLNDHPNVSKKTKNRITATARDMGYRHNKFASNLRKSRTQTIGVIVPRISSYFMATAIAGIENITTKYGYNLIITQSQESGKKEISCISTLFNSRVDGLLVSLSSDTKNLIPFNIFFKKNIPVVFFDRAMDCKECIRIIIDNYKAGYEATSHLISQGCKRIVHMGGSQLRNVYSERLRGYKQALEDSGIKYDEELVLINDLTRQSANDYARQILKMKKRPDGIFTANDTTAVEVICEMQLAGVRIPEDIAVVGFNDEPISTVVQPNLTTINYPAYEVGETAATTLINKLNNTKSAGPRVIVLNHSLIIRKSSERKK